MGTSIYRQANAVYCSIIERVVFIKVAKKLKKINVVLITVAKILKGINMSTAPQFES